MNTVTEKALTDIAAALKDIATIFEVIGNHAAADADAEHAHTWVFVRQDTVTRAVTDEIREQWIRPQDRQFITSYLERTDVYVCSGCLEYRHVHVEDLFENPVSLDGRPLTRFWRKEVPNL